MASNFLTDAREIEIFDLDEPRGRANTFGGNLYLGHDDPAEAQLNRAGFALYFNGATTPRTANTNPGWKALLVIAPGSENYDERVLTYNATSFSNLAAPSAWPGWPTTLSMGGAPRKLGLPMIPAGTVPNRRQGYCYGWNGANPEAVLGSFYLDHPAPEGCPQNLSNVAYITTNTTLTSANSDGYAGQEIYVSDNVTLTISGTFTLRAANGHPARLNLNGRLVGSGNIAVEGGSELVIRPLANTSGFTGSIPLTGAGSCLMVREGARFDLAPGQFIDASDGALVAVLTGGTISLGANARLTMRATAAAAQIRPGSRFEMGQNARVEFLNPVEIIGTDAQPVVFESAGGGAWAGVTIAGAGSHLDHVALNGGTNNLTVTGSNTVVEHVVSTGASGSALVVRTPAVRQEPTASPGFSAPRETNGVVVRDGRFAGSAIGVQVHLASGIALSRNAVAGNGFGVSLVNATVSTFRRNVITASGTYGLYLSGTSNLGVGPADASESAAPSGCSAGLNRITGSGSAEIMAESGSAFGLGQNGFAGTLGGYNEISDAAGVLVWTGEKRASMAEFTWWGGPLDPTRIVGSVSTDYALSFNPTAGSDTASGCATASEVLADARTRLNAVPVTADHEAAVRDLLVPALDADPAIRSAARALLATWAQPAGDVTSDPVLAATATAAGITTARVDLADDDATAAQAALDAAPEPLRDEVRVERYRMTAAVAEADERFADALTALDAAGAIVLPAPPMDAGKRGGSTPTVDPQRAALAAAAAAAQVRTTEAPAAEVARTEAVPTALRVLAPWPNPSRGSVTVAIEVPVAGALRVEVFDVLGRSVAVLHDGWAQPGRVEARLGAGPLAAGLYVVRATLGTAAPQVNRFTVVR